jgi:hypothetical protein
MQYRHDGCNCSRKCETDHSVCDDCAEQDDTKVPAGDGGSDEAKNAEEDHAETGARGVRGWSGVHGGPAYMRMSLRGGRVLVSRA